MNKEEMDNPQATSEELAWLAGVVDSDGYVSIRRTVLKKSNSPQYSPRVGIVNTNTKLLAKSKMILDAIGVKYYFREKGRGAFDGSSKQVWLISVETLGGAFVMLNHIRPYMAAKDFQADCLLEFCERRLNNFDRKTPNHKRRYGQRDYALLTEVLNANGDIRGASQTIREDALKAKI